VSIVHPNVFVGCGLTLLLPAELRDADAPIGAAGQLAGGDDTGGCRSPLYSMIKVWSDGRVGHAEHER
jgi:hypothetical protein